MDEFNNYPSRKPTFCIASLIITTIPLLIMLVGTIRLLILGGVDESFVSVGAEILLHLAFCALGAPFASMISILATYIARERGEDQRFCLRSRVYAKIVLFGSLAFLAVSATIAILK